MGLWHIIKPEETRNLSDNPSFETGTTGWSTGGANTIAKTAATGASFKGLYALKCTYQDSTNLALYAVTGLATGTYHAQGWVKVPDGWDGGNIRISTRNLAGVAETYNAFYTDGTSTKDIWIYLETKIVIAADGTGDISLVTTSAPTAGKIVRFDAFMYEALGYATTYVDGDEPGCVWDGAIHGSTSTRSELHRGGGRLIDLEDYNCRVRDSHGIGMPPVKHRTQTQALMPGALYLGSKTQPRKITLVEYTKGTSVENLHSNLSDLVDIIAPDLVKDQQPFTLRYTGSNDETPVEIDCVYDRGLEFTKATGGAVYLSKAALRVIAYDPYWRELGQDKHVITTTRDLTTDYMASRINGEWDNLSDPANADDVRAIATTTNHDIYVGGDFINLDGTANCDYIAKYVVDTDTWSALGTGMDDDVYVLLADANDDVYVGGIFTDAGGTAVGSIAMWDGAWNEVETAGGFDGSVQCLAIDPTTGYLWAGGGFQNVDGGAMERISYWDGAAWNAAGAGFNGVVATIAISLDGIVYAGGAFTDLDGGGLANANYIAYWDGSAWNALGTGMNATVRSLSIDDGGRVYAGGTFTTANGKTVNRIAKLTNDFFALDPDPGWDAGEVTNIEFDAKGNLWTGGSMTNSSDSLADRMYIWNGSSWLHTDINLPGAPNVRTIHFDNDINNERIYIGFTTSGTAVASDYSNNIVTNSGSSTVYPVFKIKRSGGTSLQMVWLVNHTTGKVIYFDYDLLDGEELTVDFTPGQRSVKSSHWGDTWTPIKRGSDFASFYLLPGINQLSIKATQAGAPTVTSSLTWTNKHWSVDKVAP